MKINKQKLFIGIFLAILVAGYLVLPKICWAQTDIQEGLELAGEETGLGSEDPRIVVARIIRVFLGFLGIVAIAIVLYGGFLYMISGGADQKVDKAKKWLSNGLIGLIIILTSFAVTSYIINRLAEATGLEGYGNGAEEEVGPGPGVGPGAEVSGFNVSISPKGFNRPLSSVAKITFPNDKEPLADNDYQNAKDNIKVYKLFFNEDNQEVEEQVGGSFSIQAKQIIFTPDSDCPEGCNKDKCFEANTDYRVKVFNLKSKDDDSVACPFSVDGFCLKAEFSTSNQCDTTAPNVNMSVPLKALQQGVDFAWFDTLSKDENGISNIRICPDIDLDSNNCEIISPLDENPAEFSYSYNYDTANLALGAHKVELTAYDTSDNENSIAREYLVASENCFDDDGNFNCDLPDCEIDECDGSDYCVVVDGDINCLSWSFPVITKVTPDSGTEGRFVTLTGYNFGVYDPGSSKVEFNGSVADLACGTASWSSTQVVVKVPVGATSGPLKLTDQDGYYNDTGDEDSLGWKGDFIVTQEAGEWIGLCSVLNKDSQATGAVGDLVYAVGENFGDRQPTDKVYFDGIASTFIGSWSDEQINDIKVPNVQSGYVSVQVGKDQVFSNPVNFIAKGVVSNISITGIEPNPAPPGQYITITGTDFGNSGEVQFHGQELIYTANLGCDGAWQQNQIVAQVPNDIEDGDYNLKVISGSVSAQADFTVDSSVPLLPGLCEVKPDNGPVGLTVDFIGYGFGDNAGKIVFAGDEVSQGFNWTNELVGNVKVPALAQSGQVYVENIIGQQSNKVNFSVKACSSDSDCDINAGEVCCNNQYCIQALECELEAPTNCEYSWYFSTGNLPKIPKIIERQCTDELHASPTPAKNITAACPNGQIGFTFNMQMNPLSFVDKIKIRKCNVENEQCELEDCGLEGDCQQTSYQIDPENLDDYFFISNYPDEMTEVTEVILTSYSLQPNYWYRVIVENGVYSLENEEFVMPNDYVWQYKTAEADCKINQVLITPPSGLISEIDEKQKYNLTGQAANCGIIDVSQYDWSWNIEKYADRIVNVTPAEVADELAYFGVNLQAEQWETIEGDPGVIQASGLIAEQSYSDQANLTIKFSEPNVIDYWPDCNQACRNAMIGAKFNTYIQKSDLQSDQNIKVYKCLEQSCQDNLTALDLTGAQTQLTGFECKEFNSMDYCREMQLFVDPVLDPASYYRVVIAQNISSISEYNLTNLNYSDQKLTDDEGELILDSFSWIFKTRDNPNFCRLETVDVKPDYYITDKIGQKVEYFSYALGAPDVCSAKGQKLNSYKYNWVWSSDKDTDNLQSDLIDLITSVYSPQELRGCNEICLNIGSNYYGPECGNNILEFAEECEDGNLINNDGCSSKCLFEGFAVCEAGQTQNCCGNGLKDGDEECDDGDNDSGDGCSANCLNEGSVASGFICGNGLVEFGEDNDYGSFALNQLLGLDAKCINRGSTYLESQGLSICGNTVLEAGEECEAICLTDEGEDCTLVDVIRTDINCTCERASWCSDKCVLLGLPACDNISDQSCCANGELEAGEECEAECYESDNQTVCQLPDWCTASCLNKGSNFIYDSYCGNGAVENGEDQACETLDIPVIQRPGSPQAIAEVLGNLPEGQDSDIAEIGAQTNNISIDEETTDVGEVKADYAQLEYFGGCNAGQPPALIDSSVSADQYACLNEQIKVVFSGQILQPTGYFKLFPSNVDFEYACEATVTQSNSVQGIIKFAINKFKKIVNNIFGHQVFAADWCQVENFKVQKTYFPDADQSIVYVIPLDSQNNEVALMKNQDYRLRFKNLADVCLDLLPVTDYIEFSTADNFCHFDAVEVVPAYKLVTELGEVWEIDHLAKSGDHTLYPIDNIYDWQWLDWQSTDENVVVVNNEPEPAVAGLSNKITVHNGLGDAQLKVTAQITADNIFGEQVPKQLVGFGAVEVFICQNPWIWPSADMNISNFNSSYNTRLVYCQDRGTYNDTSDDLPRLKDIGTPQADISPNCNDDIDNDADGKIDYKYINLTQGALLSGASGSWPNTAIGELIQKFEYDEALGQLTYSFGPSSDNLTAVNFGQGNVLAVEYSSDDFPEKDKYPDSVLVIGLQYDYDNGKIIYDVDLRLGESDPQCLSVTDYEDPSIFEITDSGSLLAEYFFLRDINDDRYDNAADAISLRIYKNEANISAREWYNQNVPNKSGSLADLKVACDFDPTTNQEWCYQGVRDGSTVYVSAGNVSNTDVLYNNIYVLGYSQGSNANTTNIFAQLIDNFRFNMNLVGNEANQYQVVKRDIQRLNDINYIHKLLKNYYQQNNSYPTLESGTYERGTAISIWPSWQSVLGNTLGSALPVDPFNYFQQYSPSSDYSGTSCPDQSSLKCQADHDQCFVKDNNYVCSICQPGTDPITCYDSIKQNIGIQDEEYQQSKSYLYGFVYDNDYVSKGLYYMLEGYKNGYYTVNNFSGEGPIMLLP